MAAASPDDLTSFSHTSLTSLTGPGWGAVSEVNPSICRHPSASVLPLVKRLLCCCDVFLLSAVAIFCQQRTDGQCARPPLVGSCH